MGINRVRVGIVGPGWWADTMYAPVLATCPDAAATAVYARNRRRAEDFAEAHGIPHVFGDIGELCASGEVDAVIVASANKTHHPFTVTALDAGLHVLCEKPLAVTAAEADDLAERARQAGLTCYVPFTYRYMPTTRWVKRLLDRGFIGRPYHLNLRYYSGWARQGEYLWRLDQDEVGEAGVLGDLGSHWIDMARWFFGEVEAVTAVVSHHIDRDARPDGGDYARADDGATVILEFENGAQGVIVVSAVCHDVSTFGQSHHFDLHGSEGTIYAINDWNDRQEVRGVRVGEDSLKELPIPDEIWGSGVRRAPVHDTYRDTFRHTDVLTRAWIAAIRDRTRIEPDFDDGAAVQRIIAACARSAAEGRRVAVSS